MHAHQIENQDARVAGESAGHELASELLPGFQTKEIVHHPHHKHDGGGRKDFEDQSEPLIEDARDQVDDQERDKVAGRNRDPAGARNRASMNLAVVIGLIDEAKIAKEIAKQRGEGERQGKGSDAKPDQRVHKNPPATAPQSRSNPAAAALPMNTIFPQETIPETKTTGTCYYRRGAASANAAQHKDIIRLLRESFIS